MEQLTIIEITDKGEVNQVAIMTFNEKYGHVKNKDIVRRHMTKIIGLLFGFKVNIHYSFKPQKDEQSGPGK
jgi:hypothetical protein